MIIVYSWESWMRSQGNFGKLSKINLKSGGLGWALLQEGLELRSRGMHLKNWSETWSYKATVSRRLN